MTNKEYIFYKMMAAFYDVNAPIVFKGAMVTNIILSSNGIDVIRETRDIDANWMGEKLSVEVLAKIISDTLHNGGFKVSVEAKRDYSEKTSASFSIKEAKSGDEITKLDLAVKDIPGYEFYQIEDVSFYGATPNFILCDKISVISGEKVFRRCKDVVDVYALSKCVSFKTKEIYEMAEKNERTFGTFENFITRKDDLEHAYNRMSRIKNKPEFDLVYNDTKGLLKPFIDKTESDLKWNIIDKAWEKTDHQNQIRKSRKHIFDIEL